MEKPYKFQEDAIKQLLGGKHIIVSDTGSGKTCVLFNWLARSGADKILIVSTPSKIISGDFYTEADKFTVSGWRTSRKAFECVSWYMLHKWLADKTYSEMAEYTVAYDEIAKAAGGISTRIGKSFLNLSKHCKAWAGFTATPGDTWERMHPYFIATGKIRNKTAFQREFCIMQHYPFPKILRYVHEDVLKKWWEEIAYAPDASEVMGQLPREVHQVMTFPAPKGYKKVKRTSITLEGEPCESNMDLLHYLRQMCATPDKLSALSDLLESLRSPIVIFYNYKCEREQILELATKLGRKVWRIDGEKHEIPTPETTGKDDIVLCHYLSGSEAINLQHLNVWLSYSWNWSYSTSKQAKGRIKRIGQDKPMFFYAFQCADTVEMEVRKALSEKRDFSEENWRP